MTSLYASVDCLFMLTKAEAFFLPALQGLAAKKIVITSNYGGQLDFLNENNSILINGKMTRAPISAQYWTPNIYSSWFEADIEEAAEKLRYAAKNVELLKGRFYANMGEDFWEKFSWDGVAKEILKLCE